MARKKYTGYLQSQGVTPEQIRRARQLNGLRVAEQQPTRTDTSRLAPRIAPHTAAADMNLADLNADARDVMAGKAVMTPRGIARQRQPRVTPEQARVNAAARAAAEQARVAATPLGQQRAQRQAALAASRGQVSAQASNKPVVGDPSTLPDAKRPDGQVFQLPDGGFVLWDATGNTTHPVERTLDPKTGKPTWAAKPPSVEDAYGQKLSEDERRRVLDYENFKRKIDEDRERFTDEEYEKALARGKRKYLYNDDGSLLPDYLPEEKPPSVAEQYAEQVHWVEDPNTGIKTPWVSDGKGGMQIAGGWKPPGGAGEGRQDYSRRIEAARSRLMDAHKDDMNYAGPTTQEIVAEMMKEDAEKYQVSTEYERRMGVGGESTVPSDRPAASPSAGAAAGNTTQASPQPTAPTAPAAPVTDPSVVPPPKIRRIGFRRQFAGTVFEWNGSSWDEVQ